MSAIQQRSILFLKDTENSEEFFKAIGQDDRDVTIPASSKLELARQEKITISYSEVDPKLVNIFEKVKVANLRFNDRLPGCSNETTSKRHRQTIFNDEVNMNQFGLRIEVAPQTAQSFESYRELSELTISELLKILKVEDESKPTFFQEWFKKEVFEFGEHEETNLAQLIVLRLWNAIMKKNVELPVRSFDLETLTSVELLLHGESKQVSLILYWDSVTRPTIVSKKYVRQENAELVTELAVLHSLSPEPWEYNPPISGLRMKIDREAYTSKDKPIRFLPTMLHPSLTHNTLYGFESKHEFIQPTGMHPTYKVSLINRDSRYPFEPLGHSSCSLMFQLDVPKQIIIDKYQLEYSRGKSFIDFTVHNGGMDLELPEYRVDEWGGSLTIRLNDTYVEKDEGFQVPLHFRYGKPLGSFEDIILPKGQLYWECNMDEKEISETSNSFYNEVDRLGIDKFANHVIFYHVRDIEGSCSNALDLKIPTANLKDAYNNELWTLIFVLAGTLYIIYSLRR
ncbi:DEKNAAC105544 [Brettanomyces naardenensis]|uniref:Protein PBN1 n=1 Tax=Brettanomyces naardenensis TaxID=13370 RepID=A0A448YTR7_BRENA|nr:DEKNAAC105544 [Brettanomyces naardenensis]